MTKHVWKKLVRIDDVVRDEWQNRLINDTNLNKFLTFHNVYEMCVFWKISKSNPKLSKYCQNCIKLVGKMFSNYRLLSCPSCYMLTNNQTSCYMLTNNQTSCYMLTNNQTSCYMLTNNYLLIIKRSILVYTAV